MNKSRIENEGLKVFPLLSAKVLVKGGMSDVNRNEYRIEGLEVYGCTHL